MSSETLSASSTPAMTVAEAYDYCRAIAHKFGANFSVGFRFLPKKKSDAVYAAYAFCRWADDIADEEGEANESPAANRPGTAAPLVRLEAWQNELERCYAGNATHPITIALHDALQSFAIPKSAFIALIDGCRQDMVKSRYANFEELIGYCDLVATSISDISLPIFGYKTPRALEYGRNLATALKLTNVTRDVGDDLPRDRIYVPQDELARFGVTEEDLFARRDSEQFRALILFQVERAAGYFRAAQPLLQELDSDSRFPTLLMGAIYARVLHRIRQQPLRPLHERIRLPKREKIGVVIKAFFRPRFI
jgi:phytoene synthase